MPQQHNAGSVAKEAAVLSRSANDRKPTPGANSTIWVPQEGVLRGT
jgi:hypothetical protein